MTHNIKQEALQRLPEDPRDLSHEKVFGSAQLADLPIGDFFVSEPMEIKNQDINYPSDFCAAYAASAVSEDQEALVLVPEYTFAKAKQIIGDPSGYGLNLRDICKAAQRYGFLAREYDPFHCETENRPDRDFLADWKNWPEDLDMLAYDHHKNSFFKVDGPYDTFDNFRSALWMNRGEQRSILTGLDWRPSYENAVGGFIDVDTAQPGEVTRGHAIKIFGQMEAKGKMWLVGQLSDGIEVGDKGIYYFSREVVNRDFTYGAFTFKDMPKDLAMVHNELNYKVGAGIGEKLWKFILYWFGFNKK